VLRRWGGGAAPDPAGGAAVSTTNATGGVHISRRRPDFVLPPLPQGRWFFTNVKNSDILMDTADATPRWLARGGPPPSPPGNAAPCMDALSQSGHQVPDGEKTSCRPGLSRWHPKS